MFREDRFSGYHGAHFDLPARDVLPRPLQRPHPPLWAAASNLASYERIARQGLGVIGAARNSVSGTRDVIRLYRETIRSADPAGFVGAYANDQVAGFALAYCHPDDRTGRDVACAAARWYAGDNDAALNAVRFASAGGVEGVVSKFPRAQQRRADRGRHGDRRQPVQRVQHRGQMGRHRPRPDDLPHAGRLHRRMTR